MPYNRLSGFKTIGRKSIKFALGIVVLCGACSTAPATSTEQGQVETTVQNPEAAILPGIYQIDSLVNRLGDKSIAVVANHTSLIEGVHLVDTLIGSGLKVVKAFAPEHGFRGDRPDGASIENTVDNKTGIPVISLYGKDKKPSAEILKGVDCFVFDIQDVGARFYTYLSTLHYIMEAAAENGIPLVVLDRPNPNIFYVDGPVLEEKFKSFVGLHPVPVVYGMTIGEYAQMINGEGWLKGGLSADLSVYPCQNYTRSSRYSLPIKPSPNLPDMTSVYWYPSLCFFEGTDVSVGRGTLSPFKIIGEPGNTKGNYRFTPQSIKHASENPPHKGKTCVGYDLSTMMDEESLPKTLQMDWLVKMYAETDDKSSFFLASGYFDKLAGTDKLRKAVIEQVPIDEIRQSWKDDLDRFKAMREKYLIYAD